VLVGEFCLKGAKADPINDPAAIPTHLLLLHSFGLHPVFTWNGPSWSISAEWWAYVVFPLAALLLARYRTAAVPALRPCLCTYVSVVYLVPAPISFAPGVPVPHNLDVYYDYGFLRGWPGFLTGMLTYEVFASGSVRRLFGRDVTGLVVLAGTVLLLHLGVEDLLYIPAFAARGAEPGGQPRGPCSGYSTTGCSGFWATSPIRCTWCTFPSCSGWLRPCWLRGGTLTKDQ
jgi:peptidoglycan/LPS O-acetylase OafA/YrhL